MCLVIELISSLSVCQPAGIFTNSCHVRNSLGLKKGMMRTLCLHYHVCFTGLELFSFFVVVLNLCVFCPNVCKSVVLYF
jgi:hypothetical protein